MSYWIDQPVDNKNNEIQIICSDVSKKKNEKLPNGFQFKTLGVGHLEEIYKLLKNHYVEDNNHIVRLVYDKDFLYWYLKYIPPGFIVGLSFKNKLVGMVTAVFIDMVIYGNKFKVPYINFLCVQSKLRKVGFAVYLIDEIKFRITNSDDPAFATFAMFSGMKSVTKPFAITKDFVIPINYPKLKEIGFLVEDLTPIPVLDNNSLHLMVATDIVNVVPKLNKFMERLNIKPFFTEDSAHHFLLPKKNIVYSFVKRNSKNEITDFVTVYKNYLYSIEKDQLVSVAQLAFYYYETMNLTELIMCLLDKLPSYDIDQLIFRNIFDNMNINITKFLTYGDLYYFSFNLAIKETKPSELCFFPF